MIFWVIPCVHVCVFYSSTVDLQCVNSLWFSFLVGCHLWGRKVGHDWSDLAAAAAVILHPLTSWCLQRPLISFLSLCCAVLCCAVLCCSVVSDSAISWTVVCQAPLSMEFSRQEYWSGMPFPTPGDLPDSGIEPVSLMCPALAGRFFTTSVTWEVRERPSFILLHVDNQLSQNHFWKDYFHYWIVLAPL